MIEKLNIPKGELIDSNKLLDKINEIISVVNRQEKEINLMWKWHTQQGHTIKKET